VFRRRGRRYSGLLRYWHAPEAFSPREAGALRTYAGSRASFRSLHSESIVKTLIFNGARKNPLHLAVRERCGLRGRTADLLCALRDVLPHVAPCPPLLQGEFPRDVASQRIAAII